jgi:NADH dehydrogenase FAD-containing subunit
MDGRTGPGGRRAVLLGAGHAHLHILKQAGSFTRRGHELVAVAPDRFWYSGLATGMLGGTYPPELDQVDVAALLEKGGGRFVRDRVAHVDTSARLVHLEEGPPLAYDALSVNLGSGPPAIGGEDALPGAYRVKPIRQLLELRLDLESRFRSGRPVRVLVAGGGPTACELAANILGLAARLGGRAEVTVAASGKDFLKRLPRAAARKVVSALERRGVDFHGNARILSVGAGTGGGDGAHAVLEGGGTMGFDVFVNATGLKPNPRIRDIGLPVDGEGAMRVDAHLRSVADAAVHGGGDAVAFEGRELPKIGVYAIRQAPVLCRNLLASLEGTEPARFEPQADYLWIMNLGDGTGLAARGRLWWHGRAAFRLKDLIDRRFLRAYGKAG